MGLHVTAILDQTFLLLLFHINKENLNGKLKGPKILTISNLLLKKIYKKQSNIQLKV